MDAQKLIRSRGGIQPNAGHQKKKAASQAEKPPGEKSFHNHPSSEKNLARNPRLPLLFARKAA
jgi:hypothetical protein